jgi:hypothetical protein
MAVTAPRADLLSSDRETTERPALLPTFRLGSEWGHLRPLLRDEASTAEQRISRHLERADHTDAGREAWERTITRRRLLR